MSNFLIGVMAAVAAIVAGLAFTLFGKPDKQGRTSPDRQEQVEPPPRNLPSAPLPDPTSIDTKIADPWEDSPEATMETVEAPTIAANLTTSTKPTQSNQPTSEVAKSEPPKSASMPPFAAIHDPNRPSTPELQDLSQEILDMGLSKQLRFIPKLVQYAGHGDAIIRRYVAYALGQLAVSNSTSTEIATVIPVLNKLSQDSNPEVRKMAIKALTGIQSAKGLPTGQP